MHILHEACLLSLPESFGEAIGIASSKPVEFFIRSSEFIGVVLPHLTSLLSQGHRRLPLLGRRPVGWPVWSSADSLPLEMKCLLDSISGSSPLMSRCCALMR